MTCTKFAFADGVSGIYCTDPSVGPFLIRHGNSKWWFEWSDRWGPLRVRKDGGDAKQPGWRSPFWTVTCIWNAQGRQVVDGEAAWSEPPPATYHFIRSGRKKLVVEVDEPEGYLDGLSNVVFVERPPSQKGSQ